MITLVAPDKSSWFAISPTPTGGFAWIESDATTPTIVIINEFKDGRNASHKIDIKAPWRVAPSSNALSDDDEFFNHVRFAFSPKLPNDILVMIGEKLYTFNSTPVDDRGVIAFTPEMVFFTGREFLAYQGPLNIVPNIPHTTPLHILCELLEVVDDSPSAPLQGVVNLQTGNIIGVPDHPTRKAAIVSV